MWRVETRAVAGLLAALVMAATLATVAQVQRSLGLATPMAAR